MELSYIRDIIHCLARNLATFSLRVFINNKPEFYIRAFLCLFDKYVKIVV